MVPKDNRSLSRCVTIDMLTFKYHDIMCLSISTLLTLYFWTFCAVLRVVEYGREQKNDSASTWTYDCCISTVPCYRNGCFWKSRQFCEVMEIIFLVNYTVWSWATLVSTVFWTVRAVSWGHCVKVSEYLSHIYRMFCFVVSMIEIIPTASFWFKDSRSERNT